MHTSALLIAAICALGAIGTAHSAEREGAGAKAGVSLPPASIAKWYPPENQRPEWFLNMLALGKSMRALGDYAALGDAEHAKKWAGSFASAYRRIGEMVPEWKGELESEWADKLVAAAEKGDLSGVQAAMRKVGVSCRSCHNEYRAVTAALYHLPHYDKVKVENAETMEETSYHDAMEQLAGLMNKTAISAEDGRSEAAQEAGRALTARVRDLASSCKSCHQDPAVRDFYLGPATEQRLENLNAALARNNAEHAGAALREIGGAVCTRCHNVHRVGADLRDALLPRHHDH